VTAHKIDLVIKALFGGVFGHVVIGIPENQFLELKAKFPDEGFKGQNPKVNETIKEAITKDERELITKHLGLPFGIKFEFQFLAICRYIDEANEKPSFESNGKKFWVFPQS
jgi:hypothetical protein